MAVAGSIGAVVGFAWSPQNIRTNATPSNQKKTGTPNKNSKFHGSVVTPTDHKVETPAATGPATGKRLNGSPSTITGNKNSGKKGNNTVNPHALPTPRTLDDPRGKGPSVNIVDGKGGKGNPKLRTNTK